MISLACQTGLTPTQEEFLSVTVTRLEIFQLHQTQDLENASTTLIESEEQNTFYSNETLLIFCNLSDGQHLLLVWRGKGVIQTESQYQQTETMVKNLLIKYDLDRKSRLVKIQQGYEPLELIEGLGGSLMIRLGNRDEDEDQMSSTIFSCRSYQSGKFLVIEESLLDSETLKEGLCSGYSALIKHVDPQTGSIRLFQWNGRRSITYERQQCALVAQQILAESEGSQVSSSFACF